MESSFAGSLAVLISQETEKKPRPSRIVTFFVLWISSVNTAGFAGDIPALIS